MTSAFDAYVATARVYFTAETWLHNAKALDRDLCASIASSEYGTEPLDFRSDPKLVRRVFDALKQPVHVCLGPTGCNDCYCAYCETELVVDRCPDADCEANYRRPTSLNRFGARNR